MLKLNTLMVRYVVNDVDAAIAFYTRHLEFRVCAQSGPHFAILERENLQLVLSPPKGPGGGSQPMPDGRRPEPGGWNRTSCEAATLRAIWRNSGKPMSSFETTSSPGQVADRP